ncbi:hypothetical protein ACFL0W_04885 [Nanoarchaeota archaeon]
MNVDTDFELSPENEKILDLTLDLGDNFEPRIEILSIMILENNKILFQSKEELQVVELAFPFYSSQEIKKTLFGERTIINLTNHGNMEREEEIRLERTSYEKYFGGSEPKAKIIYENRKEYYSWLVSLEPGDQTQLIIIKSYFVPVLFLLLGLILVIFAWVTRTPVTVLKYVESVRTTEGAISHFKIGVNIINMSGKQIKNLKVVDRIPHIALFEKKEHSGFYPPDKVGMHEKHGTILSWEIDKLEPKEERILNYMAKSKFDVIGKMKVPPAVVHFKNEKGKRYKIKSNKIEVVPEKRQGD